MQPGLQFRMVGRERERRELAAALDGARAGRGSVFVVLGEAGAGKSTLVSWAEERALQAGATVARAGCSAAGMPALWPVRRALSQIAPEMRWGDGGAAIAGSDRELLFVGVVEAVARAAAARPLLLVLEDLHWADPMSLLVTRVVVDAVPSLPVVLVLTARDDPAEQFPELRRQLEELPTHARRMVLPPLDEAGVAALATMVLEREVSGPEASALHRRTGGNPFFVHEVLRLRESQDAQAALVVPSGVSEVIQRRVARVSQPCAALLGLAAVAGETFGDLVEQDLVADEPSCAALLDEAVAARLLEAHGNHHQFRHALIREVVEQTLSPTERASLHEKVATRLEERSGQPSVPARLAYHWSRVPGEQAAARSASWSLRAGRAAVAELAFESAAEHFRHALAGPETDVTAVSIELGEALQLCGRIEAAREVLLAAARDAEDAGRGVDLARSVLALGGGLAGFEVPVSDHVQAALLVRADELLPESDRASRAAVRGRLSLARAGLVPPGERVAMAAGAVRLAREAGDTAVESAVLGAYCDAIAGPDYVRERIAAAQRIADLTKAPQSLHDEVTLLLAYRLLVVAHLEAGDLAAAESSCLAYERVATRLGVPLYRWLPDIWRGMRALFVGDVAAALRHAAAAERIGQRAHSFNAELMVFTLRMQAHLDQGTQDRYAAAVYEIVDQIGPLGIPPMYLAAPARFLLAAGDEGPARAVLRVLASRDPASLPKDAEWLEAHWAIADVALKLDDREAVERLYDVLLPYAGLWAVDGIGGAVFGAVAEQLARLADRLDEAGAAAAHREAAAEQYRRQGTTAFLKRLTRDTATAAARIHRDGATWRIDWHGRHTVVADAKGMRDLAVLLSRPGQEVPALELVEAAGGPSAEAVGGGLGPVLDDTARRAYRQRLEELAEDLDEAEGYYDLGRADSIRAERAVLVEELAAAVGLGGRPRIAGDPADRARKAVTMRIRAAIRTIESQDPALARHLTNALRTGRRCSYQPETPVSWQT